MKTTAIRLVIMVAGVALPSWVYADNPLAIQDFQTALAACERGIQMEMPRSRGSLRIMQSLSKRYQRNMQNALARMPALKDSNRLYSGDYFVETSFSQAYQSCETNFVSRVKEAELATEKMLAQRQEKQQENQALLDQLQQKQAMITPHIEVAIKNHCIPIINQADLIPPEAKNNYFQAKQKILELDPEAVKQFYTFAIKDSITQELIDESKPLGVWFETCEAAFIAQENQSAQTVSGEMMDDEEGPMLPPSLRTPALPADPATTAAPVVPAVPVTVPLEDEPEDMAVDEEGGDEEEYQAALTTVTGDKKTVLTQMKRMPDYVNNDDYDLAKASLWQFESPDADRCEVYQFQGDTQVKKQDINSECPPF
ncbi:hypothetical protein [Thioflexithrix psekupsensis]|uniref:Uncharacterized protein n=1 Tax=Thioflexithrix psekupsensis TaxID=1570016 RepID=A0A251X8S4_9GAMM|nr:hypothetical protein [Thioflexithrix psekupsensis]OUD14468.1 hypothetical protein TPSD3_09205 [Thioflexithrix psekupsensis]